MKELLYLIVGYIARIHDKLMRINDGFELHYSDKQLHFLVVGLFGMALVFVTHALFQYLASHDHVLVISWIYVFTLLVGLTFAIEIGQGITHTGAMDFADIVFGLGGFLLFFAVYAVVRGIVKGIRKMMEER
ncbi:MAG: hypothetical protein K6G04_07110 [Lachnospiraceae bacterium]|nr:hypothetical protein [Lachnospiraceae bacterium]